MAPDELPTFWYAVHVVNSVGISEHRQRNGEASEMLGSVQETYRWILAVVLVTLKVFPPLLTAQAQGAAPALKKVTVRDPSSCAFVIWRKVLSLPWAD